MKFFKKGNFGVVIGFMFAFFAMFSVFFGSFYMYQDQIKTQDESIRSIGDGRVYEELKSSFSISEPIFKSGRVDFEITNLADINLNIGEKFITCFDVFKNGIYISSENFEIYPKYSLSGDYSIIEPFSTGILSISNVKEGDVVKIISCNGIEREFELTSLTSNWFSDDFNEKVEFVVSGSSSFDVYEYQIKVNLNSSIIDFNSFNSDEIRFIGLSSDYIALDLNFDTYSQSLIDNSRNSFLTTLGNLALVGSDDPQKYENGLILSALNFDGGDFVRVNNFDSLENSEEFTVSFWVNLDLLAQGQNIFESSNAFNIELGDSNLGDDTAIRFNFDNSINRSVSGILETGSWNHVVLRFLGGEGCLFFNSQKQSCFNETFSQINGSLDNLIIGNGLDGKLDEVKIYNYALLDEDIISLNKGDFRFIELDYFNQLFDSTSGEAEYWVKLNQIPNNSNITLQLYYDLDSDITLNDLSSIENVFSYKVPRTIGYLTDEYQVNSQGLSLISLKENNDIRIGDDQITLDDKQTSSYLPAVLDLGDEIKSEGLVQIDGNSAGAEMITPISWAGTQFYFRGFRNGGDNFCILSPFGDANVDLLEAGVIFSSILVNSSGNCVSQDIATGNNFGIQSDLPVLVSYSGGGNQDAFVFYPATSEELYGSPSQTIYMAAGSSGSSGDVYESDLTSYTFSLGAYGSNNNGGNGADGNTNAFKVIPDNLLGVIQQADGDGSESTVFVPLDEFSTYFGLDHDVSYISVVSNVGDANCSVYDSSDLLVENVATGTGGNGIYKYNFGVGNDALYVSAPWTMTCSKPVWPYVENTQFDDDEMNVLGYKQMRQYIYPEPSVSLK